MANYRIELDTKKLDRILREMPQRAEDLLELAARRVEKKAKTIVPVDTGALKNSITSWSKGPLVRFVGDGVEYGIYVEKGTSRMGAQPWLGPSIEAERGAIVKAWGQLLK